MQAACRVYRALGFGPSSLLHSPCFTAPFYADWRCNCFAATTLWQRQSQSLYTYIYRIYIQICNNNVACNAPACRTLRVSYHIRTERRQRRSKNRRQENGKLSIAVCNVQRAMCDTDNRHATVQKTKCQTASWRRGSNASDDDGDGDRRLGILLQCGANFPRNNASEQQQ